jgi:photosystem II stability/assembly factor-like uncharacterized protein
MSKRVLVMAATKKGVFTLESDETRRDWKQRGPFCEAWPMMHAAYDVSNRAIIASGGNAWYGPAVWRSTDLGETWTHSSEGLTYGEGKEPVVNVWSLRAAGDTIYAGVEPAGLFRSRDGGDTWEQLPALNNHPAAANWVPGGGGLCLHTIAVDPADNQRVFVAISTGGLYASEDGGESWEPRNGGLPIMFPEEGPTEGEPPQCVHHFELAAGNSSTIYQQHHFGMFASHDTGRSWENVGAALPSTFGFAAAAHPREQGTWYLAPLNGDSIGRYMPEGRAAIWKTTDGGKSWRDTRAGLPQDGAFLGVLRQGMAVDTLDPAGVYFGTNGGNIFASRDEGETWEPIAEYLPSISSIETAVIED